MPAFAYHCPFCNRPSVITNQSATSGGMTFYDGNKHGAQVVKSQAITCPHPDCREYSLSVYLYDTDPAYGEANVAKEEARQRWRLIPSASCKKFPDHIPAALLEDYQEACEIRELSPKASATLSRRCLQGMLRDYWAVNPGNLYSEIEQIRDRLSEHEWKAIDAVRELGNIGAHMKRDINEIVEVDPDEAELLTGLIETLLEDWYVARYEKQQRMAKITAAAASKKVKPEVSKPV